MKQKTLCIVAAGSGGHILPALVLGKRWHKDNPDGKVIFFCSSKKLDKKIIEQNSFLHKIISLKLINFPGKKLWLYPKFLFQLSISFVKSFFYLQKFRPEKVITTGGYIAIPVCVVGKLLKSYIELFELNVVPGKAIKALASFANKIFITFEKTKSFFNAKNSEKCVLQNYPVRFTEQDKIFDKGLLIEKINKKNDVFFSPNKKTIFLLGGSQGSIFLNDLLKKWLLEDKNNLNNVQVFHQTGALDKTDWKAFYESLKIPALIFSYDENIKDYYLIADLIISRAGAGTLFELEFFQKKSLIIPLQTTYTDHQYLNAIEMAKRNPGLFFVHGQEEVGPNFYELGIF